MQYKCNDNTRRHFNPRTREGCDTKVSVPSVYQLSISIHAPARGATGRTAKILRLMRFQSTHPRGVRHWNFLARLSPTDFNPRTREGCDAWLTQIFKIKSCISIHAPARGATRGICGTAAVLLHFNPRTREGCDARQRREGCLAWLFQSTHPRGVRQLHFLQLWKASAFQSTHPRGVRHRQNSAIYMRTDFNPRTREGCDGSDSVA